MWVARLRLSVLIVLYIIKPAADVFLLDCLRFDKLIKILRSVLTLDSHPSVVQVSFHSYCLPNIRQGWNDTRGTPPDGNLGTPSVWCNSYSNLLKRKQSNRKTCIMCCRFDYGRFDRYIYQYHISIELQIYHFRKNKDINVTNVLYVSVVFKRQCIWMKYFIIIHYIYNEIINGSNEKEE